MGFQGKRPIEISDTVTLPTVIPRDGSFSKCSSLDLLFWNILQNHRGQMFSLRTLDCAFGQKHLGLAGCLFTLPLRTRKKGGKKKRMLVG